MTFSVHSMASVNSALQHMSMLQSESAKVHDRIATGLKVGSASDNGTVWATAQVMRSDNESRQSALTSIDLGTGVVETALAAAEGISDLMVEMQSKLVAATDTTLDEQSWRSLMTDFIELGNQATRLAENASFNDLNLLESGGGDLSVLIGKDPSSTMTIAAEDLTDGGGIFDAGLAANLPQSDNAIVATQPTSADVVAFEASLVDVTSAVSRLGVGLRSLEIQKTLLVKQMDVTSAGIGNLVDADLGRESAKLQALQVREQLGIQALEIANRSPRVILNFFQ
ncbi:MAG: flagellin [Maricaulis maris]|jgi:flagellin|uniref:Flagellin n=1 Tax=Maricaulis maris (strain MCS10) TaxID=394221 RepID=Q0AMB5_MARMM|nr:flagellin [Maricaulis maris]ABI66578.1 flagellin domain protein [Maricaulis maris MCS10]